MPQTIKCPNCGASLVYKEGTDSLVCPYCGTKVPIAGSRQQTASEQTEAEESSGEASQADDGSVHFKCSSCGAELITDAHTAATICPFCGSPAILKSRISGKNRPQSLIPFRYDKKAAQEEFRKWTRSGFFTPKGFRSSSTLDHIEGIYVPYWMFSFDAHARMEAKGSLSRSHREGDFLVTETDHFLLMRETQADFSRIPADASEQMPDDVMDSLEPFNYGEIREFNPSYLSGFMAENSNYEPSALQPRAERRADSAIEAQTRSTFAGFENVIVVNSQINDKVTDREYSMFPVWVLTYRYRGKDWKLYLNGQTGRRIGSLPVDPGRVVLCFILCFFLFFGLSALINLLMLTL